MSIGRNPEISRCHDIPRSGRFCKWQVIGLILLIYAFVVHIKRSQCRFGQSKYSIMNEGENIISAIPSNSPTEAVSEMGVLQFASKGRGIHDDIYGRNIPLSNNKHEASPSLNSRFGRGMKIVGICSRGFQWGPCLIVSPYHICWLPSCELAIWQHVVITGPGWNVRRFKNCISSRKSLWKWGCSPWFDHH